MDGEWGNSQPSSIRTAVHIPALISIWVVFQPSPQAAIKSVFFTLTYKSGLQHDICHFVRSL